MKKCFSIDFDEFVGYVTSAARMLYPSSGRRLRAVRGGDAPAAFFEGSQPGQFFEIILEGSVLEDYCSDDRSRRQLVNEWLANANRYRPVPSIPPDVVFVP